MHLLSESSTASKHGKQYFDALFLQAKAFLASYVSASGALDSIDPPEQIRNFIGEVEFSPDPIDHLPMKFRLAVNQKGQLTNSWMSETQGKTRYLPVFGDLSCGEDGTTCKYYGDSKFAQIWNKTADLDIDDQENFCPQENDRLAFMGFKNLKFSIDEGAIKGVISDELCLNEGFDDGTIRFNLKEVGHAQF